MMLLWPWDPRGVILHLDQTWDQVSEFDSSHIPADSSMTAFENHMKMFLSNALTLIDNSTEDSFVVPEHQTQYLTIFSSVNQIPTWEIRVK